MAIWESRVLKEYDLLSREGDIEVPGGKVKLLEHSLDTDTGICCLEFYFELVCWTGCCTFDCGKLTRYPFDPPKVRVTDGFADLPPHIACDGPLLKITNFSGQWTPGQTIKNSITAIAQATANRGPEEALVPRMNPGRTYMSGEVITVRNFPKVPNVALKDSIFPCSVETIEDATGTTKRDVVVVITSVQLLETCHEEDSTGLMPLGIGPFSIGGLGSLVIRHCVPLSDLKKLKLQTGESVTVEYVNDESATQTYFMSKGDLFISAVKARVENLKVKSAETMSALSKHVDRAQAAHQEAERTLKLVESAPTLNGINRVMDLCRQTTELYSAINDDRSEEVVALLHGFLANPVITALIENGESSSSSATPQATQPTLGWDEMTDSGATTVQLSRISEQEKDGAAAENPTSNEANVDSSILVDGADTAEAKSELKEYAENQEYDAVESTTTIIPQQPHESVNEPPPPTTLTTETNMVAATQEDMSVKDRDDNDNEDEEQSVVHSLGTED